MSRPTKILLPIILVLVITGVAVGLWVLQANRTILEGELDHDFGLVRFDQPPAVLDHTFSLRNVTDEALHIQAIKSSCSCTTMNDHPRVVAPGAVAELTATMRLTKPGLKRATVHIVLADQPAVLLHVRAIGRQEPRLFLAGERTSYALTPGKEQGIAIGLFDYEDDERPEPPTLTAPEGVTATFGEWTFGRGFDLDAGEPARWNTLLKVTLDAETLDDEAAVIITHGEDTVTIPVRVDDAG